MDGSAMVADDIERVHVHLPLIAQRDVSISLHMELECVVSMNEGAVVRIRRPPRGSMGMWNSE